MTFNDPAAAVRKSLAQQEEYRVRDTDGIKPPGSSPRLGDYREQWRTVPDNGEVAFDFWYPRQPGEITHIRVGLMDVRAADDIRISYDFERDGWLVEQASVFSWSGPPYDEGWKEAAFIPAWQFKAADDD